MKKLLIVDDEINMQKVLGILFHREGYIVKTVSNGREAVKYIESGESFDLIISDLKMPVMDGIDLLKYLKQTGVSVPLILITAYGSISEAVDAMKLGAEDFITKPFNKDDLKSIVKRILNGKIDETLIETDTYRDDQGVIYVSEDMRKIMELVRKIAPSNLSILLTGESGTGKGVIARSIHKYAFPESSSPFVSINCPAVPESLLESELFGYKKGAFTGADRDYPGKVSMADGGTLFLDEIGDLSISVQAKLLKLLEEGVYEPLGSTKEQRAQIRIISATNQNIGTMIDEKRFREDLYYRINSVIIEIPPLRERKPDIHPLSLYFIDKLSSENNRENLSLSNEGLEILIKYRWPGNVRELRNVIHHAVILADQSVIGPDELPLKIKNNGNRTLYGAEKRIIEKTLLITKGNISEAARKLGMSRGALRHRLKKYSLPGG